MNVHFIEGSDSFGTKVVGSSYLTENFLSIFGPKKEDSYCMFTEAFLRLENNNPYDPNAVCVLIDGLKVGYLSRNHALLHRFYVQGLDCSFCVCKAKIIGGWKNSNGCEGHFGVNLDIAYTDIENSLSGLFHQKARIYNLKPELMNEKIGF